MILIHLNPRRHLHRPRSIRCARTGTSDLAAPSFWATVRPVLYAPGESCAPAPAPSLSGRRVTATLMALMTAATLAMPAVTATGRDVETWAGASCPVTTDGPLTGDAAALHETWLRRVTDTAGIDLDALGPTGRCRGEHRQLGAQLRPLPRLPT